MTGPRIPENEAEKRVLEAFESRAGKVDVGNVAGGSLRAGFLRDLYLGRLGNGEGWEPRRVMIAGANVAERLELDHCKIHHHLCFEDSRFLGGILLLDSAIPSLSLEKCTLRGNVKVFSGLTDHAALNANRLRAGYVHLVSGSVTGLVSFFDADIGGLLACVGGTFEGDLCAGNLRAREMWVIPNSEIHENVNLNGTVSGKLNLIQNFEIHGNVNLDGADISGKLSCDGEFRGCILAEYLKAREVIMRKPFIAKGNVSLGGAIIRGQLACSGGIFEGGLSAEGLRAEQIHFSDGFKSKGGVILSDAVINSQLNCRAGVFEGSRIVQKEETGSFVIQGLKAGDVFLDKGFTAEYDVNIVGASIRDRLSCSGGEFKSGLYLTDAEVKTFESDKKSWPKRGSLHLDGFHYRRLAGEAADSAKDGLEWLNRMEDEKFHPQPYEQLMSVYRHMGHTNWAREIGFELESQRHDKFRKIQEGEKCHELVVRNLWRVWYRILRATIGYGYKPFRFLGWVLTLWLGGTLAFGGASLCDCGRWPPQSEKEFVWALGGMNHSECLGDLIIPSEGDVLISDGWKSGRQIPKGYPRFVPATYALEALFPVLDFGQLDKWHSGNGWLSLVRWGMTFSGTMLLAILTFFGLGALGPRWRGGEDSG